MGALDRLFVWSVVFIFEMMLEVKVSSVEIGGRVGVFILDKVVCKRFGEDFFVSFVRSNF